MKIGKINSIATDECIFASVLKHIDARPERLFYAGSLPSSRPPVVAIVGSRRPTPYGIEVTRRFAGELARRGVVVVSGLAYGIDAVAHEAALDAKGTTLAILAGGLHKIYPVTHTNLAERIVAAGGAIISEHPEGVEAHKYHFLARNRLVSGLADAILVTEATERSGTLSTISHALMQNKEIFAVPGAITSLLSVGPNKLLQQGAHVALHPEDILAVIAPHLLKQGSSQAPLPLGNTPLESTIIELLRAGVRDGDELHARSGAKASEFLQALTMLELNGIVKGVGGNKWSLV